MAKKVKRYVAFGIWHEAERGVWWLGRPRTGLCMQAVQKRRRALAFPQVNFLLRALIEPDADKKVLCEPTAGTALVALV